MADELDSARKTLSGLAPGEGRRVLRRTIVRIVVTTVALLVLYAVLPVAGKSGVRAVAGLTVGLVAFVAVLTWQLRAIVKSDHPVLRAIEGLAVAVPTLLVVFASTYLALSRSDPSGFTEPLNRVDAFYFTATTLSTVGYGDIAAKTDATRIVVTVQLILDLFLVVGIGRVIFLAAKVGLQRRDA